MPGFGVVLLLACLPGVFLPFVENGAPAAEEEAATSENLAPGMGAGSVATAQAGLTTDLDRDAEAAVERLMRELGEVAAVEARAWIEIPQVRVTGPVLDGVDDVTIRRAVGHFPETPWPGEGGNVALAAHRTTLFRGLRDIAPGDSIRLTFDDACYRYRVHATLVVDPEDVWVLDPVGREALTLVTCYPFDYPGHAPQRFVVRAFPVNRKEGDEGGA